MPRGAEGLGGFAEIHRGDVLLGQPLPPEPQISGVGIINVLLRYRVMIVTLALLFGLFAGFKSVTAPKGYTVESTFMPKGARGQSQLGGLAAQFGVNLGGDGSSSPQFYADLLGNRTLLWPVAQRQYTIHNDSGRVRSGTLVQIYRIRNPRPEVVRVKAVEALQRSIKPTLMPKTGAILMSVTTGNPELSLQIAQNVLDQVNIYNLANRQKDAAATRAFVERQVAEKRAELRQAEDALTTFLERNRQYRTSPELTLEEGRLEYEIRMRQSIYTTLLQSYETARIDEVRDLPVITVIDPPELPIVPNRRGGVKKTAIGILTGLILGCLIAFPRDRIARKREAQTNDFLEFAELKREALGDLTHPWRPVTRVFKSRRKA
jgi:uncharacterized protein involved in exopolysaccharide biosynthesis